MIETSLLNVNILSLGSGGLAPLASVASTVFLALEPGQRVLSKSDCVTMLALPILASASPWYTT
jgi:hypothetical protein